MQPEVSIVMTAYRRAPQLSRTLHSIFEQRARLSGGLEVIVVEDGDDGGATRAACEPWPVRFFQRARRPEQVYSNQAVPLNIGIRQARGRVLILQNAECLHATPDVIARLAEIHDPDARPVAAFASVLYLKPDGSPDYWGSHPEHAGPSPYFFCGSLLRSIATDLGGFDENFAGWGAEDDDFAFRLRKSGVKFRFLAGAVVHHQWHEVSRGFGLEENRAYFENKVCRFRGGEWQLLRANQGREWGSLES